MDIAPLRMQPAEAQAIIAALGGQAAVMQAFGLSSTTVKRIWRDGCGGANCAALRLAYRNADWAAHARQALAA